MKIKTLLFISLMFTALASNAQDQSNWFEAFKDIYKQELGSISPCEVQPENTYRVCSNLLKNEGNAPFVMHHNGQSTGKVAVLFHGLSDSPFFFRSIAPAIHQQGFTVVVALLPGHGKKDADADMEDAELANRWYRHVKQVMDFAKGLGDDIYMGGFSTGGALATYHVLKHPQDAKGLMLFSGALALDESVESMANIWGIKWLARLLDGDYAAHGPNPYKYPGVAKHSAFMLTDVIFDVREEMANGNKPNLAIFTAHSMADTTTPWRGVEDLMSQNQGANSQFVVEADLDVCHADLVVSAAQLIEMNYDASQVDSSEKCKVPKANPQHAQMLAALVNFLQSH